MKTRKKVRYNNSADSTIEKEPENDLVKKASSDKSRGRTLARHLRKSGQLVSLNADVASVIAEYAGLSVQIQKALDTGKKSLEKAILGSQDGINAAQNISGNSAAICEYTVEMYEAIEYLHHIFEDNAHEINQLIETVNSIAKATNETQKSIEGLKKSYDKSDEFVSDIINIGELIDVAGLNASLEAGRSGKPLAGYTIIAEKIQKTAESYEKTAVGFNDLIADIQQRIGETGVKINDIVEKIRTVTVMSKGVKSAYNDITSEFAELENMAEGISELADEVLSENNMVTAFDAYIETAEYILPIFDNT
ncbi:MAG: hypothetical protein JXB48_03785, partial [Candidatus Latescibacteria bacterium]|nr:hypothetical protein [Candidatus Latescibacterota bacterium]